MQQAHSSQASYPMTLEQGLSVAVPQPSYGVVSRRVTTAEGTESTLTVMQHLAAQGLDRRQFLTLLGLGGLAVLSGCGNPGAGAAGRGNAGTPQFRNELKIPPLETGTITAEGVRRFELTMRPGWSELLAGRATTTWGFNGSYLGPTLRARTGEQVEMVVRNELPETSTVHWHGMRLPAAMDGGPHQPIGPGEVWAPAWLIDQPAATLWYHPHPHGQTAWHVYRGLAGLFIIDGHDDATGLPDNYGVDDIPLVIQDRVLGPDGSLREDAAVATWGLMGNDILVNGTYDPHLRVTTSPARFRLLNGSNARTYNLGFDDGRRFVVVGNDVGLLPEPVSVDEVSLSPGERVEVVVGFTAGDSVVLRSRSGKAGVDQGDLDILRLDAAPVLADAGAPPTTLPGAPGPIEPAAGARVRHFQLSGHKRINGREMDLSRVDEVVPAGAVEIWEVENAVYSHNFHIHDAAFTVLEVDGRAPPAFARGRKDTVFVPQRSTVRLAVAFGDHADPMSPYMYHCHMLRHEDAGMMGQFTIVTPGTENTAPRSVGAPGGGHHP